MISNHLSVGCNKFNQGPKVNKITVAKFKSSLFRLQDRAGPNLGAHKIPQLCRRYQRRTDVYAKLIYTKK